MVLQKPCAHPKMKEVKNVRGIDDARIVGKASAEVSANIRGYWVCLLNVAPGTPAPLNRKVDESQVLWYRRGAVRVTNVAGLNRVS
jgi:hypothetical protein